MSGRSSRARAAAAAVGIVMCGCGSMGQPDGGGPPLVARPAAPEPPPHVARPDALAPRVAPFHPAADDILRDLAAWDAATSAQRRARAEALAARLPGFALKEMKTFECGTQRHEVAIFLREPVMTGDDMELVLLPCGPPATAEAVAAAASGTNTREERIAADAPFLIARTEVSMADWFCASGRDIEQFDPAPVVGVSFVEALEFCVNSGLDLPSSAQWDFACRAGATTRYFFGNDAARLPEYAWTAVNSAGRVHPPAQKLPNAFGLFDVYGNLREWCRDGQRFHVCPRVNGQGFDGGEEPTEGNGRAQVASHPPNMGFRPVRVIPDDRTWDEWPHREIRRVSAKGTVTYRLETGPGGKSAWTATEIEAALVDCDGRFVGSHCISDGSPFVWAIGSDHVMAQTLHERPPPNAGAVAEAQFVVKPVASSGAFARVTLIERVSTTGGAAPQVDATRRTGDEISVPYTADYVFLDTIGMGGRPTAR